MIFLKKDRPKAQSTYYGSLPQRIRLAWGSSSNSNNNNQIRGIWKDINTPPTPKDLDKENNGTTTTTGGEDAAVENIHSNDDSYQQNHQKRNNPGSGNRRGGPIGTEAMIEQHLERNTKVFKYPPQGYWSRIEMSILYSMILEPSIFPTSAICEHMQQAQEEFDQLQQSSQCQQGDQSQPQPQQQPQHFMEPYLYERPPPGLYTAKMKVSYRQFLALLVLAGEEWPAESKVPQALCQAMVGCVVQYADRHGLDRQSELEEGLKTPLETYSRKRGAKITLSSMWPVYVGVITTAVTGTAVPLGLSYLASFALNEKNVKKESQSEENRLRYKISMERASNPEQESLLVEHDLTARNYDLEEEEEEVILWDDNKEDTNDITDINMAPPGHEKKKGLFEIEDDRYSYLSQELKHHPEPNAKTSALAGGASMLLLGNSIRSQQEDSKAASQIPHNPLDNADDLL